MSYARSLAHKEGSSLMQKGAYLDAQKIFSSTLEIHGSHVSILSDLASTNFLIGDMCAFRLSVERLENEFKLARPQLSPMSRILTLLSLSKFYEELGKISHSLETIETALDLLTPGHPLDFRVRAQKLRLLAAFGRDEDILLLYRHLQALKDTFHSLCLAEARLFGLQSAWAKFLENSKKEELHNADFRQCILDLLEISIETGDSTTRLAIVEFLSHHQGVGELDAFEGELFLLARLPRIAARDQDFFRWTRAISPLCHLRLLALEAIREGGNHAGARVRLVVQLESIDNKSRQLFMHKWKKAFQAE